MGLGNTVRELIPNGVRVYSPGVNGGLVGSNGGLVGSLFFIEKNCFESTVYIN
jgi:hypothetical protein